MSDVHYSHSNPIVISSRCEHASVLRIPSNSVDTTSFVPSKGFDSLAILLVPDVYLHVCSQISIPLKDTFVTADLHCH
jgi:hypothetical protein